MSAYNNGTFFSMGCIYYGREVETIEIEIDLTLDNLSRVNDVVIFDGRYKGNTWDQNLDRGVLRLLTNNTIVMTGVGITSTYYINGVRTDTITSPGRNLIKIQIVTSANTWLYFKHWFTPAHSGDNRYSLKDCTIHSIKGTFSERPHCNFHYDFDCLIEYPAATGLYSVPNLCETSIDEDVSAPRTSGSWTASNGTYIKSGSANGTLFFVPVSVSPGLAIAKFHVQDKGNFQFKYIDWDGVTKTLPIEDGYNEFHVIVGKNGNQDNAYLVGTSTPTISEVEYILPRTYGLLNIADTSNLVEKP